MATKNPVYKIGWRGSELNESNLLKNHFLWVLNKLKLVPYSIPLKSGIHVIIGSLDGLFK